MSVRLPRVPLVTVVSLVLLAACGSDDPSGRDSGATGGKADAPGGTRDASGLPDAATDPVPSATDAADLRTNVPDAATSTEGGPETTSPGLDLAAQTLDGSRSDAWVSEAGPARIDADPTAADGGVAGTDATTSADTGAPDAPADSADAAFQPGPATAIVVNSSNTAEYNLADGTWKVFYFDAEPGQLYVISELTGLARGYLSTSPTVSPTNYQRMTDPTSGVFTLTPASAQRFYIAVGVSGGGASGSFQVADGGRLLALGTTTLTLTAADAGDAYEVFRFPVSAGRGYVLDLTGPVQPNLGLSVAARPEPSFRGEFSFSDWGLSGSLPFANQEIKAAKVATSTTGYYFLNIRVSAPITFTIQITESP